MTTCRFDILMIGQVFRYDGALYIRTSPITDWPINKAVNYSANCLALETTRTRTAGLPYFIADDTEVECSGADDVGVSDSPLIRP